MKERMTATMTAATAFLSADMEGELIPTYVLAVDESDVGILNWTSTALNGSLSGINGTGSGEESWWTSVIYPSGYTPLSLLIASIFVTIIMIMIVGGNTLVIIAIFTERSLKGIQNWFIGSLAVADCLLGLIIMPFSLAKEMMGYWVFGQWWCDVHSAVDVLLCTSSIMNLCLISLDRYWSITHAIEYLRKRTPERVVIMIATVWVLSGLVSIPPLLGWKKETPQGEFPKCELSEDIGYVLYSALGSFYIPSCIMVFVYIRIYFAARARSRRAQENKMKRRQSQNIKQEQAQHQADQQKHQQLDAVEAPKAANAPTTNSTSSPLANGEDANAENQVVVANGHPALAVVNETTDRRFSLTSEMSGLKPSPGLLTAIPSVSADRLSGSTQHLPQQQHQSELHSTAPSSLMAVNESSTDPLRSLHQQQSSLTAMTNGDQLARQSSSLEQRSNDDISYAAVCSHSTELKAASSTSQIPPSDPEASVKEVTLPANMTPTALTIAASGASINRRASLIFPSRVKFQKLAKRFGGGELAIAKAAAEIAHHQQQPQQNRVDSPTNKGSLQCEAEWSTSSCPSSPCAQPESQPVDRAESVGPSVSSSGMAAPTAVGPTATTNNSSNKNHGRATKSKSATKEDNALENELASEIEPSSSDSGTVARCTVVRPLKIRFCRPGSSGSVKKSSKAKRQVIDTGRVVVREADPARERRRINRAREKRATLILGLIMGAFIACWLPFFFLYLLAPMCPSCNIQPWGFAFAFWLGYINSALNPVIYTIFNKDFRHAFRRIIFRCSISNNY